MTIAFSMRRPFARLASAALLSSAAVLPASADVISGTSNAYSASADLTANVLSLPPVVVSAGPYGPAGGSAPIPYNNSNVLASVNVNSPTVGGNIGPIGVSATPLTLSTGIASSNANSTVDGLGGMKTTMATNQIAGLNATVLGYSISIPFVGTQSGALLTVMASAITTTASVSGDYNAWTTSGGVNVASISIALNGTTIYANANIAANTTVDLNPLGLGASLVLNEQIIGGDGVSTRSMTTNFLHLKLSDVGVGLPGVGNVVTLNSDIIIGHAFASQTGIASTAVPEPSSLAMAGLALAAGGFVKARRRKAMAV